MPRHAMTIKPLQYHGIEVPRGSYVWIHEDKGSELRIEFNGRMLSASPDQILKVPVEQPTLEQLRNRDACFGLSAEHFEVVHEDEKHWFRVLLCKTHGRYFLEDTRGGVGIYTRVILVEDTAGSDPVGIWRKYHAIADDMLNYLEIAL